MTCSGNTISGLSAIRFGRRARVVQTVRVTLWGRYTQGKYRRVQVHRAVKVSATETALAIVDVEKDTWLYPREVVERIEVLT